jgi:uncharacterized membrane protein
MDANLWLVRCAAGIGSVLSVFGLLLTTFIVLHEATMRATPMPWQEVVGWLIVPTLMLLCSWRLYLIRRWAGVGLSLLSWFVAVTSIRCGWSAPWPTGSLFWSVAVTGTVAFYWRQLEPGF